MALEIDHIQLIENMMNSIMPGIVRKVAIEVINELVPDMISKIIREEVPPIVHEIVDPQFAVLHEELREIKQTIRDHSVRINRLEKIQGIS
jgi:hypothetical protein